VNKINLFYTNDIVNKQNIGQDLINEYINYNNLLSSTTNKNKKYDSIKDTEKVILCQNQKNDGLSIIYNFNFKKLFAFLCRFFFYKIHLYPIFLTLYMEEKKLFHTRKEALF